MALAAVVGAIIYLASINDSDRNRPLRGGVKRKMVMEVLMPALIRHRRKIQFAIGMLTVYAVVALNISLWAVFGIAVVLGIVFGKTYCKWMCPLGFMMETMTANMGKNESNAHMYHYYKVGCPISWVQGFLNKFSLFKIKVDSKTCTSCGVCDKSCYITAMNPEFSFYKKDKKKPMDAFNCSKCLKCVDSCPTGSIKYKR